MTQAHVHYHDVLKGVPSMASKQTWPRSAVQHYMVSMMTPNIRWCSHRSLKCLLKLLFWGLLLSFLLTFIKFTSPQETVHTSIMSIPSELTLPLQYLPPVVKQYVLDYKNICETFVHGRTKRHEKNDVFWHQNSERKSRNRNHRNTSVELVVGSRGRLGSPQDISQQAPRSHRDTRHHSPAHNKAFLDAPDRSGVSQHEVKPYCPCVAVNQTKLDKDALDEYMALPWHHLEQLNANVLVGGMWKPEQCVARQRVAIIIPYRDREEHLKAFLTVMHPFLQRQHLDYHMFVIEQKLPAIFNRASIMNIGFVEAQKHGPFDCYIYHDVDLLPESDLNFYSCIETPLHIGAYMNKFHYRTPYEGFFGGAMALTAHQMETINGFPNIYYGWGGEDDDIYRRILAMHFTIHKHPLEIGKTHMIKHAQDKLNPINPRRFQFIGKSNIGDGLDSLLYIRHKSDAHKLYTLIQASVEKKYEAECIVDHQQEASAPDNYLNCYQEQNFVDGLLDCCRINTTVYCCNKTKSNTVQILFALIILSLVLFFGTILWRKRDLILFNLCTHYVLRKNTLIV